LAADEHDASLVLWLHLARRRAQQNDVEEFKRNAAEVNLDIRPGQLVAFQLGKRPLRDFAAAIRSVDACEAPFHPGESLIRQGNLGKAHALLRTAFENCALDRFEYHAASAELMRMGENVLAAAPRAGRDGVDDARAAVRAGRRAAVDEALGLYSQALDKGGLTKGDRALVLEKRVIAVRQFCREQESKA
jgi:hypothetical protein